jgi:hypothetical protein
MAVVIQRASSATVSFTTPQEIIVNQADDSILVYGQDAGSVNRPISTDTDGDLQVDVLSSALPVGASTEAKQDDIITAIESSVSPVSNAAPSAPTLVNANITSNEIISANANRAGIEMVNTSINIVSLAFGVHAASLLSGITLYPGDTWVMDEKSYTTLAINAIGSAASCNLAVQEFNKIP